MTEPKAQLNRNVGLTVGALLASSATLLCCVLPAVLVAIGAGAALAGLVTAVPQLVWLSEHKPLVFGVAAVSLTVSGWAVRRSRTEPCPADPELARACVRMRRFSAVVYWSALASFALGVTFAFVLPALVAR